jgi:class 3 adenylate cyclase
MSTDQSSTPVPRGTVTFLFSDIDGSTDLLRHVGDDVFAAIRADHRRLLREAFATHGGCEMDTAGDGFFIAFDSAKSAVAAAVDAQVTLAGFAWPAEAEVRVRMGLHTAEPYLAEDGYVGVGVHRAARICDAARGGQILLSNASAGIVEDAELPDVELLDLGEHRLKGLPREQRLFQLSVSSLPSQFGPPRTAEAAAHTPGTGTFLLTDLSGHRKILMTIGDEAGESLLADYYAIVGAAIEAHGGIVIERGGDAVMAAFRNPGDAVRAVPTIHEALDDFTWPRDVHVTVSIVVHSGRWSGNPRRPEAGTALLRLAMLDQSAESGQVLISQTTAALLEGERGLPQLRSLGRREIPGFDEPVTVYGLADEGLSG